MRRVLGIALAATMCACAPAPPRMAPTDAIELLERFAAGAATIDICTPDGRLQLRGAVRSYGKEMQASGVEWPNLPAPGEAPDNLNAVDITVLIAFASGFIEASDLRGPARLLAGRLTFAHLPEIRDLREAARVACGEVAALQQAAARYVIEAERFERLRERAERNGGERARERARRQAERAHRALQQMNQLTAAVEARLDEIRNARSTG